MGLKVCDSIQHERENGANSFLFFKAERGGGAPKLLVRESI